MNPKIVIDTNVLVAALRSRSGASFKLLSLVNKGRFQISLSVPLTLEYEDVLMRQLPHLVLTADEVVKLLNYLCRVAYLHPIFFLWRPFLKDPKDEMILELAVAGSCTYIVTFNKRDFVGVRKFGIRVVTPREFLVEIGELS